MGANEHPSLRCKAASSLAFPKPKPYVRMLAVMGTALDASPENELCAHVPPPRVRDAAGGAGGVGSGGFEGPPDPPRLNVGWLKRGN